MNTLIRYSSCNDLKILFSDGKMSVLPQKQIFSLEMDTGFVTTDLPFDVLMHLKKIPYAFLADSLHYNDVIKTFWDDFKVCKSSDININISLNARLCNTFFSNGNTTFFTQNVGRMAACKQGIVKYVDFSLSEDESNLYEILKKAYVMISNQLNNQPSVYSSFPIELGTELYILAPQAAAFFMHEILGHIFELDNWENINNILCLNKEILPTCCTLIDNPLQSIYFRYGEYDDGGKRIHPTTIIKNGFFNECITLHRSAEYSQLPIPRMSNICLLNNPKGRNLSEMCAAYKNYVLIEEITNGGLVPETGDFFILCAKQYYVDSNGEKHSINPATYCGKVKELCNRIIEVGNDMMNFIGICSKNRQNIFVSNSAPSMVVLGLTMLK